MPLALHGTAQGLPGESRPLWITAIAPTALELTRLSDEFGFDTEVLEHVLDPHERPRVRERGLTVLVVLRMPVFEGDGASIPYRTTPLGIVLGPSCGLTLCARESELTRRLGEYAEREVTYQVRRMTSSGCAPTADSTVMMLRRACATCSTKSSDSNFWVTGFQPTWPARATISPRAVMAFA